jgi:hypothetical protein
MRRQSLIDLYVPVRSGAPDEVADVASNEGLDAVLYVADSTEELPSREEIEEANARGRAKLHVALGLYGPGYRWTVLVPGYDEAPLEVLEATDDEHILQTAVEELQGALIPMCPNQNPDQEAAIRSAYGASGAPVGIVSMVVNGSSLGRHMDLEDAVLKKRRVLGATGPFGSLDQVGRFATVLPASAESTSDIVRALNKGLGIAVELRCSPPQNKKKPQRRRGRRRSPRRGRSPKQD